MQIFYCINCSKQISYQPVQSMRDRQARKDDWKHISKTGGEHYVYCFKDITGSRHNKTAAPIKREKCNNCHEYIELRYTINQDSSFHEYKTEIDWSHELSKVAACHHLDTKLINTTQTYAEPISPIKLKIFNNEDLLGLFNE